ncbi:MAG TPA: hypothetical protein VJB56_00815 [Candidatus Paceibacterota bacterium]
MDDQLGLQMKALEGKIDSLQRSIDKLKRIFVWILIISVVMFVLPLIGLVFAIPQFLSVYTSGLQ